MLSLLCSQRPRVLKFLSMGDQRWLQHSLFCNGANGDGADDDDDDDGAFGGGGGGSGGDGGSKFSNLVATT